MAEARIYTSELALLYQLLAESPDLETGGELLGLWSHQGSPTIMLVTGPDADATRTETHFMQPPDVHMMIERHMWDSFGLQVLGIWHSHHHLGLHELSNGDRLRTQRYATNHGRVRYVELLGYLDAGQSGRPQIRPYLYSDAQQLEESPVSVLELPGRSPIRDALLRNPPPTALHASLLLGTRTGQLVPAPDDPEPPAEGTGPSAAEGVMELMTEPAPPGDEGSVLDFGALLEAALVERADVGAPPVEQRTRPEGAAGDTDDGERHTGDGEAVADSEVVTDGDVVTDGEVVAEAADGEVAVDMVLALEEALAKMPERATRLVRLSIEDSELELSIEARDHRAKLFFRTSSPREIEYRRKLTSYPVLYKAESREMLADFYYERLVDALEDVVPGLPRLAARGRARAT